MNELKNLYSKNESDIKKRLEEFAKFHSASKEDLFIELCYCLCTPMSNARKVFEVINFKNKQLLIHGTIDELKRLLRGHARFHNNKAAYIFEARKKTDLLKQLPKNVCIARHFLVNNFKGLSFKEASHFLRNIGYRNIAIIDGHIIDSLYEFGITKHKNRPSNEKEYLWFEDQMRVFARTTGIDVDELDLLLWFRKTRIILK
ncbi:MAG: hypothetical protein ABIC91_02330 [Nanoarchaeota archaeon]|nr:hypothetical protein [Nanoarchaeota archaeon]MBU1030125.1 hypothetical protein [Nanoarchaeota archaeon]MBU1850633.1 hypothetical protein [Nanoarchaeota archaeon]